MKVYDAAHIKNIAVVGHGSDGKTTLVEAILSNAGAIERRGKVEDGNTTTDYDPAEIRRHISITTAVAPVEWSDCKLNLIDAPGFLSLIHIFSLAHQAGKPHGSIAGALSLDELVPHGYGKKYPGIFFKDIQFFPGFGGMKQQDKTVVLPDIAVIQGDDIGDIVPGHGQMADAALLQYFFHNGGIRNLPVFSAHKKPPGDILAIA